MGSTRVVSSPTERLSLRPGERMIVKQALVADDDKSIRSFIREYLSAIGYEAKTAPDGQAAKDLLTERDFDLLITDLDMPILDGLALLDWARKSRPKLTTILCSGSCGSGFENIFAGRADAFLPKPFMLNELKDTIDMLASRSQIPR